MEWEHGFLFLDVEPKFLRNVVWTRLQTKILQAIHKTPTF